MSTNRGVDRWPAGPAGTNDERLLVEVARTAVKPLARFKASPPIAVPAPPRLRVHAFGFTSDFDGRVGDREAPLAPSIKSAKVTTVLHQCLNRAVNRAMARDLVKRNVITLCSVPKGQPGRPSKSLKLDQAMAVMAAAESSTLHAYIVVSLLTGARTDELRALRWDHVDLDGRPDADPPVPPSMHVWHSVREGGDTKTRKSRRTLALPQRCVDALKQHRDEQDRTHELAGPNWVETGLVFTTAVGTELDAANVRRAFRRVTSAAGLDPGESTPRELRHSFVSLLSESGVPIEDIADLVGHTGTSVTEKVYRHQLRPVLLKGAVVMDRIFPGGKNHTSTDDSE